MCQQLDELGPASYPEAIHQAIIYEVPSLIKEGRWQGIIRRAPGVTLYQLLLTLTLLAELLEVADPGE